MFALILSAAAALAEPPRIDAIEPPHGTIGGGFDVVIRGTHFSGASVRLDRQTVTPLEQSDSEIRLRMPAHDNGYAVLSVANASGTAYGEFLYLPPLLTELDPGDITTVAGVGLHVRDYGDAKQATISPGGITYGPDGALYIAESGPNKVSRVTTAGLIERVAGRGTFTSPQNGDGGPAVDAQLSFPLNVAVDPSGNVYIPDHLYRIRKVSAETGIITTIAGDGQLGFSGEGGPAHAARIGLPTFAVADAEDLFFIDFEANRIRRIHFDDNRITTFAGNGTRGYAGDGGPATQASFDVGTSDFGALALDAAGNLYLGDSANRRIRRIERATGIITTVIGPIANSDIHNVGEIRGLAIHPNGNIYYSGGGIVETSASGTPLRRWFSQGRSLEDGVPVADAYFRHVVGLAVDPNGDLAFADSFGRVFRLDLDSETVSTIAGIAPRILLESGPALATPIGPADMEWYDNGLLVVDTNRIRRIETDGSMTTIAGSGLLVFPNVDIPAIEAPLAAQSIDVGSDGTIDYADFTFVFRIGRDGIVRRLAGRDASCGNAGDGGPPAEALLCQPWDSLRDVEGNVFIADTNNNRIRRIDRATHTISMIAGGGGKVNGFEGYYQGTYCGDGGLATAACLNTPFSLAIDSQQSLFVADFGNFRIRRIAPSGIITTFAQGSATSLRFDPFDRLYANLGDRIVRYDRDGKMTVLAGTFEYGFRGDGGPATSARLDRGAGFSAGLVIDPDGNILFADAGNRRIRAIRYGAVLAPPGAQLDVDIDERNVRVEVLDGVDDPAPAVRVELTAPSSGASCRFPNGDRVFGVVTGADGTAVVRCATNCVAGTFTITARPAGASATESVTMTNEVQRCRRRSVRTSP